MSVHVLCVCLNCCFYMSCVQLRKTKNMVAMDGDVVLSGCGCICLNCVCLTCPSVRQAAFNSFFLLLVTAVNKHVGQGGEVISVAASV